MGPQAHENSFASLFWNATWEPTGRVDKHHRTTEAIKADDAVPKGSTVSPPPEALLALPGSRFVPEVGNLAAIQAYHASLEDRNLELHVQANSTVIWPIDMPLSPVVSGFIQSLWVWV